MGLRDSSHGMINSNASMRTPIAEDLESDLDDSQTQKILEIFDKVGLSEWLVSNPFKKIKLTSKVYTQINHDFIEVNGLYSYQTMKAEIATSRDTTEYGHSLDWGRIDKISHTGRTALEAVQFTALHETGHHIHAVLRYLNKLQFVMTMNPVRSNAVSNYAKVASPIEYFAETFAAWILYRTESLIFDNTGYGMIGRALEAVALRVGEYDFNP